jgi:hypothetical protein
MNKELLKQVVAILALGPNVRIEIINQIYVMMYKKYLCFCWFEHYVEGNSRVQAQPRHTKFPQAQTQHNKRFYPMACTKTTYVTLMWKDFEDFSKFITSTGFLWEHALVNFPALTHFLSSWVEFKKSISVPLLGPNFEPPIPWRLGPRGETDIDHAP